MYIIELFTIITYAKKNEIVIVINLARRTIASSFLI